MVSHPQQVERLTLKDLSEQGHQQVHYIHDVIDLYTESSHNDNSLLFKSESRQWFPGMNFENEMKIIIKEFRYCSTYN